jgi:putative resolvase
MATATVSAPQSLRTSGQLVSIGQAAALANVNPQTIRRYMEAGQIEGVTTPGGHRRLNLSSVADAFGVSLPDQPTEQTGDGQRVVVAYARVSTQKQKAEGNLDRQVERLEAYCQEHYAGQTVKVIAEVGSGLSDQRQGFLRMVEMLAAGRVSVLVCEYRDRIARFGVGVVQRLCEAHRTEFVESRTGDAQEHSATAEQEMAKDVLAILAVYSNRAMGKRGGAKTKVVPPAGLRERVAQLAGSGLGRRDIAAVIVKENWTCENTGRKISGRYVRRVLESMQTDGGVIIPKSVQSFLRRRCTLGVAKRARSADLYAAYVAHCQANTLTPLNRDKWTDFLKRAVPSFRLDNGRVSIAYGLTLRGA